MKPKKWLTTVAASVVAVSVLAGCGSNNANDGGASPSASNPASPSASSEGGKKFENMELNVAVFQGGYGREYWDTIAEDFMKDYPGTKINITASPKIAELVRPKIVAGNPPDFMYIAGSDNTPILSGLIKDNALLDLTDVFNEPAEEGGAPLKDKILPGVLESRSSSPYGDGKVYLAPYNFGVMGLWYNKTLFDEKSIAVPKTWDEWFSLNATAKDNGRACSLTKGCIRATWKR